MDSKQDAKEIINSFQNPKVKNTIALQKSRERKKQHLFLVEGRREIERALHANYVFRRFFICRELFGNEQAIPGLDLTMNTGNSPHVVDFVSPRIYSHIAYRGTTEGIIGWAEPKSHQLNKIRLSDNPLVLVIDAIEKPGNLGAILRTADAVGIDALIISDSQTEIYNPNVVRSSLGALFTTQIGIGTSMEVAEWLKEAKCQIFCTALTASKSYTDVSFRKATAIVMGTESTGLSEYWLGVSDQNIIIPMHGTVDSMNVSVSAGIVLFEALRQRNLP